MSHVATVLRLAILANECGYDTDALAERLTIDQEEVEHDSVVGVIDLALSEQDASWIEERIMA